MKIFGIGLERTGTSSLAAAMQQIGFTTVHLPRTTLEIDQVDFANDITVACRYLYLDQRYPGSKFILTTRAESAWLESCARWYGHLAQQGIRDFTADAAAEELYGRSVFYDRVWTMGRRRHESAVRTYFAGRPGDLLVMDICGGDGWGKLLPFLAELRPFPRENVFQAEISAGDPVELTAVI